MDWIIDKAATLYILIIVARWLIELVTPQYVNTGWFLKIKDITEPLLKMIRNLIPRLGNFDFSYIVAIIGIRLTSNLLTSLL